MHLSSQLQKARKGASLTQQIAELKGAAVAAAARPPTPTPMGRCRRRSANGHPRASRSAATMPAGRARLRERGGFGGPSAAAKERLTRSAAKLEAEMEALSGLLGEEDAAVQAADMQSRAGAESVKRSAKQLEQQTVALKRILHKVKPFLRSESVNTDAALAIRNGLASPGACSCRHPASSCEQPGSCWTVPRRAPQADSDRRAHWDYSTSRP